MRGKILIVAPHPDDEVLGCASFLLDMPEAVTVAYVTMAHPLFPEGENILEAKTLADEVGFTVGRMNDGSGTNLLDLAGAAFLTDEFEKLINELQPTTVLLPAPSYNQDHRAVYDAALTAMRPHDRNHFVKRILLYEQPETFGTLRKPEPFRPNYFRKVDGVGKLRLYGYYKTQQRAHRSARHLCAMYFMRGMEANMDRAEAFEVVRWVE